MQISTNYNTPNFGMAVKFTEAGRRLMIEKIDDAYVSNFSKNRAYKKIEKIVADNEDRTTDILVKTQDVKPTGRMFLGGEFLFADVDGKRFPKGLWKDPVKFLERASEFAKRQEFLKGLK
jgi:hypothetical protein